MPGELRQLQEAIHAAAWDSGLAGLLVLQLPIEDCMSPFTRVPAGSGITDPDWAAASSAAAAAKAAAAAGAAAAAAAAGAVPAPDAKGTGGKPGSAVAGGKVSSSGSAGCRPGSSVAGGSAAAAAAAALPEEVPGCKELARALLTVRDQAQRFDRWQAEVDVYRMPAPAPAADSSAGPRMGYYRHLLDSVPPERQSVPLVLHAMLEQVSCASTAIVSIRGGAMQRAAAAARM